MTDTTATGAVYDRGYRPYDGERGGQREARWALGRATVRRALGLRRPWRQKVFPWSLLVVVAIPAIVNVGLAYLTRDSLDFDIEFITYREYVGVGTALLLFVALTAPDVICPDRRQRMLPLIFARPLTGTDYVLTKIAAMTAIVFAFGFLPHIVLFVGQAFVDSDGSLTYVRDNAEFIWQVPVAVAIVALYYSVLGILAASFTNRRAIAGATFLIVLLVASVVSAVLSGGDDEGVFPSMWAVVNLLALPLRVRDLVFLGEMAPDGPLAGIAGGGAASIAAYVVVVAAAMTVLIRRYRWIEA